MAERKAGRPPKEDSEKRTKQVMLTFTENEYDKLKSMQKILNQATLTATLMLFIEKGKETMAQELVR